MDIERIFLDNPDKEYHIRELARMLKKSPTTISTKLKLLEKEGIVTIRKERNHTLSKANSTNPFFKTTKICHNIMKIRKSGVLEYLNDFYNYPKAIILFGSFQKGENTSQSDIDICVISSKKSEPDLTKYEKKLKHTIQLFRIPDISTMKNKDLANNIINGIVVNGYLEVLK